ncbi:hypothetical protein ACNFU2_06605 [Chryseobacterium sp. PTM-20240506]|uniref:hypothetical protein n=1 Tax=Chryseobacterium sp. PTM-20240506 TaxID=3400631 RepID=UPI003AAB1480
MDSVIRQFVEMQKTLNSFPFNIEEFMICEENGIPIDELIKHHNHEIWRECECGNEEDLRKTFFCSVCGKQIFKPKE